MRVWQRLWIYQAERFPLVQTVPLLAVFSAASITVSAVLAGRALPGPGAYLAGLGLAVILFFQMRAADEWKDRALDRAYRPERPIPRGLVSLRLILGMALALIPLAVLLAWSVAPALVWVLAAVWLWLGLMTAEFGLGEWLVARPVLYLLSHMAIMPLIDLLLTGVEWVGSGGPAAGLWLFLALSFVNGCVLEIGRKIWAPESERDGVETYSRLWGPRRAATIWLGFVGLAAVLLGAVGLATGTFWGLALVGVLGFAGAGFVVLRFHRAMTLRHQKLLDHGAGIWVLLCYGAAGFLPLFLGGA